MLRFFHHRPRAHRTSAIALHTGACGEEFSVIARELGGQYGVCTQRSAEYLNWRYQFDPLGRYELLTARRAGTLVAYAIFTQTGEDARLVDLFGVSDEVICDLVDEAVFLLRKRGVVLVSAPILGSHPWVPLLHRRGFSTREAEPVVIYAPRYAPLSRHTAKRLHWFFMHGDRDS
jgi:hypothetical protein